MQGVSISHYGQPLTIFPFTSGQPDPNAKLPVYYLRHADDDMSQPSTIEMNVIVNRWGWCYASNEIRVLADASSGIDHLNLKDDEIDAILSIAEENDNPGDQPTPTACIVIEMSGGNFQNVWASPEINIPVKIIAIDHDNRDVTFQDGFDAVPTKDFIPAIFAQSERKDTTKEEDYEALADKGIIK